MTDASATRIRRARPEEAEHLTALVLRSKAHWGYDDAFMARCRGELTVTPEYLAKAEVWVCESRGVVQGVTAFMPGMERVELDLMFVEPNVIGTGLGRDLFERVVDVARTHRVRSLLIASDPGAAGFYERMGARRLGEVPSNSIPGRMLPYYELRID